MTTFRGPFRRVLLKISGEALMGDGTHGVSPTVIAQISAQIRQLVDTGRQVSVVVGGGNIFRGLAGAAEGMDRTNADYMGMLATMINALALQDGFERAGVSTRVMSGIEMPRVADLFVRRDALAHLEAGRVLIFGGGTGSPYFTTDTAAALRAAEIDAQVILKATKVDGIYDADPVKVPTAIRYETMTFSECLTQRLKVMDATAFSLCRDNDIPIVVFALDGPDNIVRAATGARIGTLVTG